MKKRNKIVAFLLAGVIPTGAWQRGVCGRVWKCGV